MGMYGDIRNKIDTNLFIKLKEGKTRLRILDHPHIYQREFTDQQTGEVNIGTKFLWPVYDYSQERVRLLDQGKQIFDQVADACEDWDGGDHMPAPFDIIITRTGTGKNDTDYSVTAVPHMGTMPAGVDLKQLEGKLKGIPIQQVLEGKQPPVLDDGLNKKTPTHADALAMAAAPDSVAEALAGDTLPTDAEVANLDNSNPLNDL